MNIRMSLRFSTPVSDDKTKVSRCHVHVDRDTSDHYIHYLFDYIDYDIIDISLYYSYKASMCFRRNSQGDAVHSESS